MKSPDEEIGSNRPPGGVPTGRLWAFRLGVLVLVVGLLMFFSTFIIFAANFGNFDNFAERGRLMGLMAVGGMFLMIAGTVTAAIGGSGLAGSLWRLDPSGARRQLGPLARLSGQLTDEAFSEMKTVRQSIADLAGQDEDLEPTEQIIQVRCRACRGLNDEDAKFCGQCGQPI